MSWRGWVACAVLVAGCVAACVGVVNDGWPFVVRLGLIIAFGVAGVGAIVWHTRTMTR